MKNITSLKPRLKARMRMNKQILKKEIKNFFDCRGAELVLKECNTNEDPVRPELDNNKLWRKIYVKYKDNHAVMVLLYERFPKSVEDLDKLSKDAFYKVPWEIKKLKIASLYRSKRYGKPIERSFKW